MTDVPQSAIPDQGLVFPQAEDSIVSQILASSKVSALTLRCGGDTGQDFCSVNNGVSFMTLLVLDLKTSREIIYHTQCFATREVAIRNARWAASCAGLNITEEKNTEEKLGLNMISPNISHYWRARFHVALQKQTG